jgi:hypothetical protein
MLGRGHSLAQTRPDCEDRSATAAIAQSLTCPNIAIAHVPLMYFDRHPPDGMKERAYVLLKEGGRGFTLGAEGHFRVCPVISGGINSGTSLAISTVLTSLLADDYLVNNQTSLTNYIHPHRNGLRISSAPRWTPGLGELRGRMHALIPEQGRSAGSVVCDYFAYHAAPNNAWRRLPFATM